jgi:hypothetical protein
MISQHDSDANSFSYNSFSSLAKAVVFRSLAHHALKAEERIGATIFAYYSLFHLVITLMYFCPSKMDPALRNKIHKARGSGGTDPSSVILHRDALQFAESCISAGLDPNIHSTLERAKDLRDS